MIVVVLLDSSLPVTASKTFFEHTILRSLGEVWRFRALKHRLWVLFGHLMLNEAACTAASLPNASGFIHQASKRLRLRLQGPTNLIAPGVGKLFWAPPHTWHAQSFAQMDGNDLHCHRRMTEHELLLSTAKEPVHRLQPPESEG